MYNRGTELDNFFDDVNLEDKDLEMDTIRKTVKRKVRIHRVVAATRNTAIVCVALMAVTFVGVRTSPAFAEMVSNIPFIGEIFKASEGDEGIQDAIVNDYATEVNQTVSTEYGDITLAYYVADEKSISFLMTGDFKDEIKEAHVLEVYMTNLDTNEETSVSHSCPSFGSEEEKYALVGIGSWDDWDYPSKIKVEFKVVVQEQDKELEDGIIEQGDRHDVTVSYEMSLTDPLPGRVFEVNKEVEIEGQKLVINNVIMYPTCTKISFEWDENNDMDFYNIEFRIVDKNGTEKGGNKEITVWEDDGPLIGSGYFTISDDFDIKIAVANLLPKNMVDMEYNVATGELTDGTGVVRDMHIPTAEEQEFLDENYSVEDGQAIVMDLDKDSEVIYLDSFDVIDDKTGEISDEFISVANVSEKLMITTIPNSLIENDEDGILHLKRTVATYYTQPNILIGIEKK